MALPAVFSFQPDPETNPRLSDEFLTDVMESSQDKEIRQALRDIALRRYQYTIKLEDGPETADFRELWYGAIVPLRFVVPLWSEGTFITDATGDAITGDFVGRDFRSPGLALLYTIDGQQELVTLVENSDGLLTTEDDIVGTFPAAITKVCPCMIGWMSPPTITGVSADANVLEVAFIEELQGIAGIDDTLTEKVAAVPFAISLTWIEGIQPFQPFHATAVATVFDAGGARLQNVPLEWSAVDGDLVVTLCTPSLDQQSCRIEMPSGGCFLTSTHIDSGVSFTLQYIAAG